MLPVPIHSFPTRCWSELADWIEEQQAATSRAKYIRGGKDSLRNVRHRYHRPIGRLTAITDGTIVEHQIANGRRVAVAAYEHVAGKDGAVGKMSGDAILVLRKVRQSVTDLNAFGIVCDNRFENGSEACRERVCQYV